VQHGFEETCQSPNFRFIGNIAIGSEGGVGVDVLKRYYDAIVFAYGAARPKRLGIPGEELCGVYSAGDFVGCYNGLPSHRGRKFDLSGENAVIIGHGNVALDVARILLTSTTTLAKTDITSYALEALEKSQIRNVFIVGRRGVLQASFTVKELRELTNIPNVEFKTTLPDDLPDPKTLPRIQQRIVQLLKKAPFIPKTVEKSCNIEFCLSPTRFVGSDSRVSAIEFERQRLLDPINAASKIQGTGELHTIKADVVFTSIGYTAISLNGMASLGPGVDVIRGVIPNDAGRAKTVSTKDFGYVDNEAAMMERVPGVYVSGWVKTGPTGVIATTMYSAFETGESLVQDWNEGEPFLEPDAQPKGWEGFKGEIERVGGKPVEWDGWKGIEMEEGRRGSLVGKEREKIVDIQEMVNLIKEI
jgi:adrenodoxin-NADP+ reductase